MAAEGLRISMREYRLHEPGEHITPVQFYRESYQTFEIAKRGLPKKLGGHDDIYFTYPVTSCGILFDASKSKFTDKQPAWESMKQINGRSISILSEKFIEQMEKVLPADAPPWKITSPSDIGKISGWREFNFMRYWSYFLYGIPSRRR